MKKIQLEQLVEQIAKRLIKEFDFTQGIGIQNIVDSKIRTDLQRAGYSDVEINNISAQADVIEQNIDKSSQIFKDAIYKNDFTNVQELGEVIEYIATLTPTKTADADIKRAAITMIHIFNNRK